jgi:predicted Zn-dependent peptidase
MVICTVGKIAPEKIIKIITRYFGAVATNLRQTSRPATLPYLPQHKEKVMDTFQTHTVIGNIAYDLSHPLKPGLLLLSNMLGGPGMNSRLNMSLREKNGIAYNIESIYSPYFGTGVFCIYFGTDKENLNRSLKIVEREMKKFRDSKLGKLQLHNAQRQLKGQITVANENKENLMLSIGKSHLLYNKVDTLQQIYDKIDAVTSESLLEIANEILDPNQLSYLVYRQS